METGKRAEVAGQLQADARKLAMLRMAAYHEAGHAVAAMALGRPVQKVSIKPDRNRLGWCAFKKGSFKPTDDWLERELIIALAGMAAEAQEFGLYDRAGASLDLKFFQKMAEGRASGRSLARLEKRILAKTENLMADPAHRLAVDLIADELIKQTEISGRAANYLFDQAARQVEKEN